MESGDHNKKHRKDDEDHRRNKDRKRHHRHKNSEGKIDYSLNCEKRSRNYDEHHHRKMNGNDSSRHKHKTNEAIGGKDNEEIYPKERKEYKQKHRTASKEIVTVDQKSVVRQLANKMSNKSQFTRSIDNIYNSPSKQPSLRKYKTFHLGETGHVPRSSEIGEEIEEKSKRRKHRARSRRLSNEKNKVSQIWYCQIDTTLPFKQFRKSEKRPETVPKNGNKNLQKMRETQRPKSTPEKNVNNKDYIYSSNSQLVNTKAHYSRESKAKKYEKADMNKQEISKKIEEEYTKKIENNLKTYFGKIEKLIDKKLNDYLHMKNTKLRETIGDNLKIIEKERKKHRHGSTTKEERSKKRKDSDRSKSSHEEASEGIHYHSMVKAPKRSGSKVSARLHQSARDILPVERRHEDVRHPDVLQMIRTSNKESRDNSMAQVVFKQKRNSNDRGTSIKREAIVYDKNDKYDECAYKELNFERGYLRGDIRTNEEKRKKVKKSKAKPQSVETPFNPVEDLGMSMEDTKLIETKRFTNKYKKQEIISSYEEPALKVVSKDEPYMETRNVKIQHLPFTYPSRPMSNKPNDQNPSTSVVYSKPIFSRKNIPSFAVCENDSRNFDFFTKRMNENQVEDFVSNRRYSHKSGDVLKKKSNFIVEGIEPAKRLVPSSAKPSKKKHMRNLECKTVSIIAIPSQGQSKKYFSLTPTNDDSKENTNKMKRLKLYYQYSLDSDKCSGSTFSEEKSIVSESVKIFSNFSDQDAKTYRERNVLSLSNNQPLECYVDPNSKSRKNNCIEKLFEPTLHNHSIEDGDTFTKHRRVRIIHDNLRQFSERPVNIDNKNILTDIDVKIDKHVTSETHLKSKSDIYPLDTENKRQAPNKLILEERDEEVAKKPIKLQEEMAVFNLDMLKSTLQAHKDIGKQFDGYQNPNNQILKYLENLYHLFESTLPQNHLTRGSTYLSGDQNDNKHISVENETVEKPLDAAEQDGEAKQQVGQPERKTVDTSYHQLLTDAQAPKVDQVTSYHGIKNTIDQVTSYHEIFEPIYGETIKNDAKVRSKYFKNKQLVDKVSSYHEVVNKATGKDYKSTEILAVLDAVNKAISKSVTTIAKDLEDLSKKKQLELEATKDEIIKIFDTSTHNIDVQTVYDVDAIKYGEDSKLFVDLQNNKDVGSIQKIPDITYKSTNTDLDDIKNKTLSTNRKLKLDKFDSAYSKNKPAVEVSKDKISPTCKDKLKEVNKNKWVSTKRENNVEEVRNYQKTPVKGKHVEKTSSNSRIPKKIKQSNINNEYLRYSFKKSQSEVSLRPFHNEKGKGRISSLICLHRYINDVNFPDSSVSCMDNFYLGRSVTNENNLSSRLFLTKDYRSPQMSSYQRRKIYDEAIRNKMKKKTLTQDKKVGQVFEVRYITLDKDFKKPEPMKKIAENKIDASVDKSLNSLVDETMDLLTDSDSFNVLNYIEHNMSSNEKSKLVELLKKILTSTEVKPKLKEDCTCNDFINFFKELKSCLRAHSDESKSAIKMNHLSSCDDSRLLRNSETYTLSKKSMNTDQYSCPTINNSDSSSNFLYNDDPDEDESQPKVLINPILGFAFNSDTNIKKIETGSFVESHISEESGYMSTDRSKYNLSFSNFFKNPVITHLLKPQGEYFYEGEPHQVESNHSQDIKFDVPQNTTYDSSEEIPGKHLDVVSSKSTTDNVIEDKSTDLTTKSHNKKLQNHNITEEYPLQFIISKSSLSMLGVRRSISEIDIQPKSSDDDLQEGYNGSYPRRVQSETYLENKTHILKTVQYVNEYGDTIYSRSMQMYTEIIENNYKEDILILKRLLDAGVYVTGTNFNTGCITLVIDTIQQNTKESKTNISYKQNTFDHYDPNTCKDAIDVKKLVTRKFFESLLSVYERESIIGTLLFDDKDYMENELYASVRNIKNYQSRNRFSKKMRTFLKKIFFNRSKMMDEDVVASYTEMGIPLDEYYQRHFQMLADYAIQHFSLLVETTPFSLDKNVELNICGFLTLLKRIKNGQFVFLRVEKQIDIEENIRTQTKQAFRNIYLTAYNEARKNHRKLTIYDMNMIGTFICKYRIGLLTRIDLITSYLGRGFFKTEIELKDAVVYVMKVLTSIIELEDFENYCKNIDVHVQK